MFESPTNDARDSGSITLPPVLYFFSLQAVIFFKAFLRIVKVTSLVHHFKSRHNLLLPLIASESEIQLALEERVIVAQLLHSDHVFLADN